MARRGLGKGKGKGYKNITGKDPHVHRQSAKGIKQPQRISGLVGSLNEKKLRRHWDDLHQDERDYFKNIHNVNNQKEYESYLKEFGSKSAKKISNPYFSAGETLRQLGGNRFIAMTGAKHFTKDDKDSSITFKIGRNAKNVNYVKIRLNSMDTYDMQFINMRAGKKTIKSEVNGVYNEQLQDIFTHETGMYTHL